MDIIKRFVRYITIDTQSDPTSHTVPSTSKQFNLARLLVEDLKALNVDCKLDEDNCIVYAHIKKNTDKDVPTIGFIAHMDTAPDFNGANVRPKLVRNYKGQVITLNAEKSICLDPEVFPCLLRDIGSDLIVTDGTSLLGADDKAGIAIIMDMVEKLVTDNNILHGDIKLAFTPDEEIGEGVAHFDVDYFNADYAYTVDGGFVDEIEYENFNASSCVVNIKGLSIHPGSAKNKMINSMHLAMEFDSLLPRHEEPSCTEGYEGFHHLEKMEGRVEKTVMEYIIRDHDINLLHKKEDDFRNICDFMNKKYGQELVEVDIKETYLNMRSYIEARMEIIDRVKAKMIKIGLNPKSSAIRGGTDGAMLTYKGLLCPNLGTGGRNFHGPYEYLSISEMRKASELLVEIAKVDE